MKRLIVLSILMMIFFFATTNVAAKENLHEISGIVSNVQIVTGGFALGTPNMTVISFKDGRVVIFRGIVLGMVFKIGEEITVIYDDEWTLRGTRQTPHQ